MITESTDTKEVIGSLEATGSTEEGTSQAPASAEQAVAEGTIAPVAGAGTACATTPKERAKFFNLKQVLLAEALLLFGLYVVLSPFVGMPLYNRLLFHPDKTDYSTTIAYPLKQLKDALSVTTEKVSFPGPNGNSLSAMYFQRPGAKKVFLICHGNGGNIQYKLILASALLKCNVSVFTFDYEGYGASQGEPTIKGIVADGLSAYDYLVHTRHVQASNLVVYGESIGTGVAAQISKHRSVDGIILQSGFASLIATGKELIWFLNGYPDSWFDNLDTLAVLKQPHAPLLLLHGLQDRILPVRNSEIMFAASPPPKTFVKLTPFNHCLERNDMEQFNNAILQFVASLEPAKQQ